MSTNESNRLGTMVHTIVNELVNHYGKKLDRVVIDEITRNLTLEMCQGPTAWAFSGRESECCSPTTLEKELLASGDYTPEELWGGKRPTCPKCIVSVDPGKPGGDMAVKTTVSYDQGRMTVIGIERSEPAKLCAASVGGLHCQSMRSPESLFCAHHRSVKSRMFLTRTTSEELEFLMQRDGEQQ
jgi:hypothetical protein